MIAGIQGWLIYSKPGQVEGEQRLSTLVFNLFKVFEDESYSLHRIKVIK